MREKEIESRVRHEQQQQHKVFCNICTITLACFNRQAFMMRNLEGKDTRGIRGPCTG